MACNFMVHYLLHWSERSSDNISLWYLAVKHLVWIYNQLTSKESGLTPLEFLTNTKSDHCDLLQCHIWGCTVFVLEPKL